MSAAKEIETGISLLLQAARYVEVPGRPEIGAMVWRMACLIVGLQDLVERDEAEIRELKLQLQTRPFGESAPLHSEHRTDWSAA